MKKQRRISNTVNHESLRNGLPFRPTHELTIGSAGGVRRIVPIMLLDGVGYESADLTQHRPASWIFDRGAWIPVVPIGGTDAVVARKLSRGPTARRGAPAKNRTIRVTDARWAQWTREAEHEGKSVADWLHDAADLARARCAKP